MARTVADRALPSPSSRADAGAGGLDTAARPVRRGLPAAHARHARVAGGWAAPPSTRPARACLGQAGPDRPGLRGHRRAPDLTGADEGFRTWRAAYDAFGPLLAGVQATLVQRGVECSARAGTGGRPEPRDRQRRRWQNGCVLRTMRWRAQSARAAFDIDLTGCHRRVAHLTGWVGLPDSATGLPQSPPWLPRPGPAGWSWKAGRVTAGGLAAAHGARA